MTVDEEQPLLSPDAPAPRSGVALRSAAAITLLVCAALLATGTSRAGNPAAAAAEAGRAAAEPDSTWLAWCRGDKAAPTWILVMFYAGIPIVSLILMYVWLRVLWPNPSAPAKKPAADGAPLKKELSAGHASHSQLIPYQEPFTEIFDFYFLAGWVLFCLAMLGVTWYAQGDLIKNGAFWINMLVKVAVMVGSSIVGGAIARACIEVDDRGYTLVDPDTGKTKSRVKGFKVNYTRKIQHFAAYAVPILVPSPVHENWITLIWSDCATLLGFLLTIKPLRELGWFFMMQFNSYDRPEDRPHTLKWIILGDIVPGMFVLVLFWLFIQWGGWTCADGSSATAFAYIFIMITGLGDGFAEPVGVHWGKHKYQVAAACGSGHRLYTRSFEGSCCVAFSVYVFASMRWYLFPNATSFALTQIVMPPLMALAEAKSPHTMDTPFLFAVGAVWLWAMLFVPAVGFLEPA